MPTVYHMVHYRKFVMDNSEVEKPPKGTLENLLRSALNAPDGAKVTLWERAEDRVLPHQGDDKQIILNSVADLQDAIFGETCLVQSNGLQAMLAMQAQKKKLSNLTTAQIYSLQEASAPKGTQFVRGMVYWLCIGDHLLFVKTQSMTAENFREYLDWLLKTPGAVVPAGTKVRLQAEFDRSQVAGDIGEVRSFRVSGRAALPLKVDAGLDEGRTVSTARRVADKIVAFQQAIPVLRALIGDAKTDSLLDSLGPKEYLSVDAQVKVRGTRTEAAKQRMGEITNELADLTEGKIQVEGKDGKISDDDAILRTRMPFDVPKEGSNFLEFDNVASQLQEVYSRFVHDGKIPA